MPSRIDEAGHGGGGHSFVPYVCIVRAAPYWRGHTMKIA